MRLSLTAPLLLAASLFLTGCAALTPPGAAPTPNPARIDLLADRLTVHFTDGSRCSADIAAVPDGRLSGCAVPMTYAVEIRRKIHVPAAAGLIEPYATVRLTRISDGRVFDWVTPEGGDGHRPVNYGHQPG